MSLISIILIVIALVVFWFILIYNGFIKGRNRIKEAWSDIEVQLKRRYNLIPNLISVVKGYAAHEAGVLEKVTQARNQAMGAGNLKEKEKAENNLTQSLKSLFAVSENYPDLKASGNFLELQRELRDTEDKIQAARRFYNSNVKNFNIRRESFPSKIVASIFNFKEKNLFKLEEEKARSVPKVSF